MEIRLGVVGCGYGKSVIVPASRADARCCVTAIAAGSLNSARLAANELDIACAYGDWRKLVADSSVDAVAVATPPSIQPEIILAALRARKPVFVEKPLAVEVREARSLAELATSSGLPNMVDFNFSCVTAFTKARAMLQEGAIGALRHVVINWQTENYTNRARTESWKSSSSQGGGTLSNFVSHSLHYLEWFVEPIARLNARLFHLLNDRRSGDSTVNLMLEFYNGAACMLSMSAAAFPGSGHKIEFYGEDGSLVLENPFRDYMRGFSLIYSHRKAAQGKVIIASDPEDDESKDGRILPVSRLMRRFFDWIERGARARPDFRDGLRVQELIAAARASDESGRWIEIP
jgi:predicted dehydrogenase